MEKSETITNIAKALVAFHKEVPAIKKMADNPFFRSKYADLSDILETVEPILCKAGLTFAQFPSGQNELITILMHESGEFIQASYTMVPAKNDPQGLGSAITYQKRYALAAVLGLKLAEEDDDGNAASGKSRQTPTPRTLKASAPQAPASDEDKTPYQKALAYLNNIAAKKKKLSPSEIERLKAQLEESDLYTVGEKTQIMLMIDSLK